MTLSQLFREARQYLDTDTELKQNRFICCAIDKASSRNTALAVGAKKIIRDRLRGEESVLRYLEKYHGVVFDPMKKKLPIQEYRHAWLEELAQEFEGLK